MGFSVSSTVPRTISPRWPQIRASSIWITWLITGGNTRLEIELITSFCDSPNVDSEKIVRIEEEHEEEEEGGYALPNEPKPGELSAMPASL